MVFPAIKDFREIQFVAEGVNGGAKGTNVTPVLEWRGTGIGEDLTEVKFVDENVGVLGGVNETYIAKVMASLGMDETPFTFEQMAFVLSGAIRGKTYGIQDGAGSDYIYTYDFPVKASSIRLVADTISFIAAGPSMDDSGSGLGFLQEGDTIQVSNTLGGTNDDIYRIISDGAASVGLGTAPADEAAGEDIEIIVLTQAFTCRAGNIQRVWESAYVFPTDLEIKGDGGSDSDAVMMSWNGFGRQWNSQVLGFEDLAIPAVTRSIFTKGVLSIDAIGGTMGNTPIANTNLGFSVKINTGIIPIMASNGELFFAFAERRNRYEFVSEIKMEYNPTTVIEIDAWKAQTKRQVEIKLIGDAFQTPGTVYSVDTCLIQMPGKWEKFSGLEDVEGGDTVTGTFRAQYDATPAVAPTIVIATEKVNILS